MQSPSTSKVGVVRQVPFSDICMLRGPEKRRPNRLLEMGWKFQEISSHVLNEDINYPMCYLDKREASKNELEISCKI